MVERRVRRGHALQPCRAVDVRDRGHDLPPLRAHAGGDGHVRRAVESGHAVEPAVHLLGHHRGGERPEHLAPLHIVDARVHVAPPRVGKDTAAAQRARAHLRSPVEPADHLAAHQRLHRRRDRRAARRAALLAVRACGRRRGRHLRARLARLDLLTPRRHLVDGRLHLLIRVAPALVRPKRRAPRRGSAMDPVRASRCPPGWARRRLLRRRRALCQRARREGGGRREPVQREGRAPG